MQAVGRALLTLMAVSAAVGCGSSERTAALSPSGGSSGGGNAQTGGSDGNVGGSSDSAAGGSTSSSGGSAPLPMTKGVSVTPKNGRVALGGNLQFSAVVTQLSDNSVTWKVTEGASGGDVSATGMYTAPKSSGIFHVCATSTVDSSFTDCGAVTVSAPAGTPPALVPGVWANITPPYNGPVTSISSVAIDPNDPLTLYTAVGGLQKEGLWKTTDGGSTWTQLGKGTPDDNIYDKTTTYVEDAINIAIDPDDSTHLYVTSGVTGNNQGFWESTDGGKTWNMPANFPPPGTTADVTTMAVEPGNFKHIIIGSHSQWANVTNAGIMESTNGGKDWTTHGPLPEWGVGSVGLGFLKDGLATTGNGSTWIMIGPGYFRTEDAGKNWAKVSDLGGVHGGAEQYYSEVSKTWYAGGSPGASRSKDGGKTWEAVPGLPTSAYYTVRGDGTNLYYIPDRDSTYFTSPETDGNTWTPYEGGNQKFTRGALQMRYDSSNGILYSANWEAGLWALKVKK